MEAAVFEHNRPKIVTSLRPAVSDDFAAIVDLSRSTGVFTAEELDSLADDLTTCFPENGDRLTVAVDTSGSLLGFIQYSPAPITQGTYYIYWIAVAKRAHGRGVGQALLASAEKDLRETAGRLIVIETSAKPAYNSTRSFYLGRGYELAGRISNYYADGDDKCVFLKRL